MSTVDGSPAPSLYVEYLTGASGGPVGALNTRKDPRVLSRDELASSVNMWITPLGVLSTRPGISTLFAGGAITGTGTTGTTGLTPVPPYLGVSCVRFNDVTYVLVFDSAGNYFVFPKYPGNTTWFAIVVGSGVQPGQRLTNNIAQLYDPTIGQPAAFLPAPARNQPPMTYTGVTTFFSNNTTAGSNTVVVPTGGSGMNGIYVGLTMDLGQNTANYEFASGGNLQVVAVTSANFTLNNTANNHSAGEVIAGEMMGAGAVPRAFTSVFPISPLYTETLFSNLFYAGQYDAPTAVYTSDPYFPESFTSNYYQSTIYPGSYQPALIGHNDGVNGGDITGLRRLGNQMLVYKQSAVYSLSLVSMYGDMEWQVQIVSPTIGCVAPNSIVSFDTFHVFLGIDGLYMTDGEIVRRIDMNVPTFFDSSGAGTGGSAVISGYTGVHAARFGSLYIIVFDSQNAGYAQTGLWLDFENVDSAGFPMAGQMVFPSGAGGIGGIASMRGPGDTGTLVMVSYNNNLVGEFARPRVASPGDFGVSFTSSFTLRADLYEDLFAGAAFSDKWLERVSVVGRSLSGNAVTLSVSVNGGNPAASSQINFPAASAGQPNVGTVALGEASHTDGNQLGQYQIGVSGPGNTPWAVYRVMAEVTSHKPVLS